MKPYVAVDPRQPLAIPAYAKRAEELGFEGLHVPETIHDSLAVALLALEHTTRATVRTAVSLAFVRSPTLLAYTAWDLSVLSGGRFELGLGTQIKQNIEGRYGVPWTEPRARMKDYVGALGALFDAFRTGAAVRYEGEQYRLTRLQPYFNPGPSDARTPPIWLGAVNAGMCELTGEVAHGLVTHSTNSDPDYLRDAANGVDGHRYRGHRRCGRARPGTAAPNAGLPVFDAVLRNGTDTTGLDRPTEPASLPGAS